MNRKNKHNPEKVLKPSIKERVRRYIGRGAAGAEVTRDTNEVIQFSFVRGNESWRADYLEFRGRHDNEGSFLAADSVLHLEPGELKVVSKPAGADNLHETKIHYVITEGQYPEGFPEDLRDPTIVRVDAFPGHKLSYRGKLGITDAFPELIPDRYVRMFPGAEYVRMRRAETGVDVSDQPIYEQDSLEEFYARMIDLVETNIKLDNDGDGGFMRSPSSYGK